MFSNIKVTSNANYLDVYFFFLPQYIRLVQVLMFLTEFVCTARFPVQHYAVITCRSNFLSFLEKNIERYQVIAVPSKR